MQNDRRVRRASVLYLRASDTVGCRGSQVYLLLGRADVRRGAAKVAIVGADGASIQRILASTALRRRRRRRRDKLSPVTIAVVADTVGSVARKLITQSGAQLPAAANTARSTPNCRSSQRQHAARAP